MYIIDVHTVFFGRKNKQTPCNEEKSYLDCPLNSRSMHKRQSGKEIEKSAHLFTWAHVLGEKGKSLQMYIFKCTGYILYNIFANISEQGQKGGNLQTKYSGTIWYRYMYNII